jgi:hypothetical protein
MYDAAGHVLGGGGTSMEAVVGHVAGEPPHRAGRRAVGLPEALVHENFALGLGRRPSEFRGPLNRQAVSGARVPFVLRYEGRGADLRNKAEAHFSVPAGPRSS